MSDKAEVVDEVEVDLSEFREDYEEEQEAEEQEEQQYSDVEIKAIEMGWNPEGVEGKRNLSAEEFVDRKELYDSIHSLKKQNKRLEEGYEALRKHYEHVETRTREKVVEELKAKKKLALEEEDYDAVIAIDDQIAEEKARKVEMVEEQDNVSPVFEEWVEKNPWYNQESEMKAYADMIGPGMLQKNPGWSQEQFFDAITAEVKARFKDKFENTRRQRSSPVEGATRSGSKGNAKYSEKDLPDDARAIMRTLVRNGDTTKEKYLEEYFG